MKYRCASFVLCIVLVSGFSPSASGFAWHAKHMFSPSLRTCDSMLNTMPRSKVGHPPDRTFGLASLSMQKAGGGKKRDGGGGKQTQSGTLVREEAKGGENAVMWVDGLSKTYDGLKYQFRDCSFVLSKGERAGLIGVNGVGKSSLLKVLAGKDDPNSGTVRSRKGIVAAYVTQDPEFPEGMTIAEALYAGRCAFVRVRASVRVICSCVRVICSCVASR